MTRLSIEAEAALLLDELGHANRALDARYAAGPERRQPVHTVYGGAHLFRADVARRLGALALESLERYAPEPETFAAAIGLAEEAALREDPGARGLAEVVYGRVRQKLDREPVEDLRIDFEDGFGVRPDDEEDAVAIVAAEQVARGLAAGTLPPFLGLRVKALDEAHKRRAARTLDLFLTTLASRTGGQLPDPFLVTLPKVRGVAEVRAMARLLERLEETLGLAPQRLRLELMIELPQALFDAEGRLQLRRLFDAGDGRVTGAHFGTYDYTAALDVTAAHQTMDHPAAQLALGLLKIACAGTRVLPSDGATTVLPVPVHRGETLKKKQRRANAAAVHGAWRVAYRNVRASLAQGIYQGWDLHPAQLPVRYAATHAFFLEGFDAAAERLARFVERAARASLSGDAFDDAATGQGLLNYFLRALNAGALSEDELARTGLTREELATRSFAKILAGRAR